MFNTSLDLLYLFIALAVLIITFFISWLLFYFILITRDFYGTVKNFKKKVDILEQILNSIKEKVEHTSTYLPLLVQGVMKIVEYFSSKHKEKTEAHSHGLKDEKDFDEV